VAERWIIGGTHDYLRWREAQKLREHLSKQSIPVIGPEDAGGFVDPDSVVWVANANKRKDITALLALDYDLVLEWPAKKPEDPWVAKIPAKRQSWNDAVAIWEEDGVAVNFVRKECLRHKFPEMPIELAQSLVQTLGPDLAQLSWEVDKVCRNIGIARIITAKDLKETLAGSNKKPLRDLVDILPSRNAGSVLRVLGKVGGGNPGSGEVMQVVRGLLGTVLDWTATAQALETKRQPDAIAEILGANPYRFKKFILPVAQGLGSKSCLSLLQAMSHAENAVLSGQRDPWTVLCGELAMWCKEAK